MYKCTDNTQSNFLSFNQPIGLHMNPENRWVKMADAIPWEIFEKKYSRLFKGKNGRVAKPLRLALGSLIIQTKYQYSDRELVDQLTENLYYQYFIGLPGYQEEPPIDAKIRATIRKQLAYIKRDIVILKAIWKKVHSVENRIDIEPETTEISVSFMEYDYLVKSLGDQALQNNHQKRKSRNIRITPIELR